MTSLKQKRKKWVRWCRRKPQCHYGLIIGGRRQRRVEIIEWVKQHTVNGRIRVGETINKRTV